MCKTTPFASTARARHQCSAIMTVQLAAMTNQTLAPSQNPHQVHCTCVRPTPPSKHVNVNKQASKVLQANTCRHVSQRGTSKMLGIYLCCQVLPKSSNRTTKEPHTQHVKQSTCRHADVITFVQARTQGACYVVISAQHIDHLVTCTYRAGTPFTEYHQLHTTSSLPNNKQTTHLSSLIIHTPVLGTHACPVDERSMHTPLPIQLRTTHSLVAQPQRTQERHTPTHNAPPHAQHHNTYMPTRCA